MHSAGERKCPHCEGFFVPDARNRKRQRHCAKEPCRRASKAASQRRWVSQPGERGLLPWRRQRSAGAGLAGGAFRLLEKAPEERSRGLTRGLPGATRSERAGSDTGRRSGLTRRLAAATPLVTGLIAHLAGVTLQEDIATMTGRLLARLPQLELENDYF
jgi:hypothetical protein